ncbi:MAG: hypothetical protein J6D08_02090 [Lachnospiraceae bacterium]|nr:hypothetical protein [Lachnospiraceae bacterium]
MSIFNIIEHIRKRPGMYLGSSSITALSHFLHGYQAAESDYGLYRRRELIPLQFEYMSEFTKIKLNSKDNLGWCSHILKYCNGDEVKALNQFFELYDEFIQVRIKKYWKAVLTEKNIQWNNSMEHAYTMSENGKKPIYENPIAVYVIELTIPAYVLAIETSNDMKLETQFFASFEQAKGSHAIPPGAEVYFGKIDLWEEFSDGKIKFDKNKIISH